MKFLDSISDYWLMGVATGALLAVYLIPVVVLKVAPYLVRKK